MLNELPKTQKALIFDVVGGPLRVAQIPVPEPEANDVLVKVLYSGVCHADWHIWRGDFPMEPEVPLVGGHEGVGIVVKMGEHVRGFRIGDNVGIKVRFWLLKSLKKVVLVGEFKLSELESEQQMYR